METVLLDAPDGKRIEAKRLKNSRLEIDTWGFDCPGCGEWSTIFGYEWVMDDDGRLTVPGQVLECRTMRCDYQFRVEDGQIVPV